MTRIQTQISLIRAINSEFIQRKLNATALNMGIVLGGLLVLSLYLTTRNVWWWILASLVIVTVIIGTTIVVVLRIAIRYLRPPMTANQSSAITGFVDKLERVADNIGTPMFIIVFRIARDLVWPHEDSFIKSVAVDSTTLHTDFLQLEKIF